LELRNRIKECGASILAVTNEITAANREPLSFARRYADSPNAHSAALDAGALVCELVWDGTYRERGFDSEGERYALPLTPEIVESRLRVIAELLETMLGEEELRDHDWRWLGQRLMIEAATAAR